MKVAAISDLHIGPRHRGDEFCHDEDWFAEFIEQLAAEHDRLILLGDIYQTEHGLWPTRRGYHRQLMQARRRLPRVTAALGGPKCIHIAGNHDAITRDSLGALADLRMEADGMGILFVHGHQFDPLLRGPSYLLARTGTWMAGRLRHLGLQNVSQWFEDRDVALKQGKLGGPHGPYARAARQLMRTRDVSVVVMGHTHCPVHYEFAEGALINTGTCWQGQTMYISIDTTQRRIDVRAPFVSRWNALTDN